MSTLQQLQRTMGLLSETGQQRVLRYAKELVDSQDNGTPTPANTQSLQLLMRFAGCMQADENFSSRNEDIDRDVAQEAESSYREAS